MSEKLPVIKAKDLIRYLCNRRGFAIAHITGSHYQLKNPLTGQKVTVAYHRQDIRRGTLKEIMAATGLTRQDLADL